MWNPGRPKVFMLNGMWYVFCLFRKTHKEISGHKPIATLLNEERQQKGFNIV